MFFLLQLHVHINTCKIEVLHILKHITCIIEMPVKQCILSVRKVVMISWLHQKTYSPTFKCLPNGRYIFHSQIKTDSRPAGILVLWCCPRTLIIVYIHSKLQLSRLFSTMLSSWFVRLQPGVQAYRCDHLRVTLII